MDRVSEGFDMDTGRNLGHDLNGATKVLQILRPKEKGNFGKLYARNSELEEIQILQTQDPNTYLNIDYEMHLGTKIDSSFFQSSRLLHLTEIQLL